MKESSINFISKLEGFKTAIKNLHWDADNMSQHKLCDDIADSLSDFQDAISEIEQSLQGNVRLNDLKAEQYRISTLKNFVEDVLKAVKEYYNGCEGEDYIGIRSECENFIGQLQRFSYLVDFTIKEDFRMKISKKINESKEKKVIKIDESDLRKIIKESINSVLNNYKI